jgi:hypothetical protein
VDLSNRLQVWLRLMVNRLILALLNIVVLTKMKKVRREKGKEVGI